MLAKTSQKKQKQLLTSFKVAERDSLQMESQGQKGYGKTSNNLLMVEVILWLFCFNLTLILPWTCLSTLSWPLLALAFTLPKPLIDLVFTFSWPCLNISFILPWPCLKLALALLWLCPALTLPLKFCANCVSNSWVIPDMYKYHKNKYCLDKFCLDKCHRDSWNLF